MGSSSERAATAGESMSSMAGPDSREERAVAMGPAPHLFAGGAGLRGGVQRDEVAQAVVVLVAGRAALQVGLHAGQHGVGVRAGELELDVLVEQLEARFAADLGVGGAQQLGDQLAGLMVGAHVRLPVVVVVSGPSPASVSAVRSLRRAS